MNTRLTVNESTLLPDGSLMVRCTVVEGPRVVVGQLGRSTSADLRINVEVIGVGVVNPNLDRSRQGLLVKITEGEPSSINGITLDFVPLSQAVE